MFERPLSDCIRYSGVLPSACDTVADKVLELEDQLELARYERDMLRDQLAVLDARDGLEGIEGPSTRSVQVSVDEFEDVCECCGNAVTFDHHTWEACARGLASERDAIIESEIVGRTPDVVTEANDICAAARR